MSQPQKPALDIFQQSKVLFVIEGKPSALLVVNRNGKRKSRAEYFKTAELALAWCRRNAATMVYLPVDLSLN
jgi:hypothetical protein